MKPFVLSYWYVEQQPPWGSGVLETAVFCHLLVRAHSRPFSPLADPAHGIGVNWVKFCKHEGKTENAQFSL